MKEQKAVLLLEDGTFFYGKPAGKIGTTSGEIAFNTGMTGYQEIFTDPSYFGQILLMATSHIGNYGVSQQDVESDSLKIAGMVCKKFSETFSRDSASGSLEDYFVNQNMVGISDVDTRALVRHIRNKGAMNAVISSETMDLDSLNNTLHKTPSMDGLELASKVSTTKSYQYNAEGEFNISVIDYGVKRNILRCLANRGAKLTVFPSNVTAKEIKESNPDGIMLTNGPGDPAAMPNEKEELQKIIEYGIPMFGICLGHQLLSIANGLTTKKMHNGHRGVNHPVKNLLSGKCEITSQNHGFVVDMDSIENNPNVELTHIHLNDNTVAGIQLKDRSAFSVQFHPESSAGPNDSRYLFDQFIENIKSYKTK